MKNRLIIIISALFSITSSFSQSGGTPSWKNRYFRQNNPTINSIVWQKVAEEDIPGIGKRSIMVFENAQYDLPTHLLPIYVERLKLPSGTARASVKIEDGIYEPLNESENLSLKSSADQEKQSFLNEDITPSVVISRFKKNPYAYVQFVPIRKNKTTGVFEKLVSFSLQLTVEENSNKTNKINKIYASNSVLATGKWHKVSVVADGMYKMDFSFLKSLGVELDSINPKNIRMYGNGGGQLPFANAGFRHDDLQENSISVIGENDGKFDSTDYVLFYGQSQHRWKYNSTDKRFHHALNIYSDSTYYFITADLGPGKRVAVQNSSTGVPTNTVSSFNDYAFHEQEGVNLLKSGRVWFGETFDIITSFNFAFNFPNIETTTPVYARVEVAARADAPGTTFSWIAGSAASTFNVAQVTTSDIYGLYYKLAADTVNFIPSSGSVPVTVSKTTGSPSLGWLNHIEANARRFLILNGDQMVFRDLKSVGTGNISQFVISNATSALKVWDVTNPVNCLIQQGNFSGSNFDFTLATDSLKEFVAFNGQSFLTPKKESEVQNQDLHGMLQSDFIIVTNPLFLEQANTLADLHRTKDNMTVSIATTEQVYNEFSSGSQDVSAIRDFVRMFYDRAADSTQLPKYLLLFGRGSYDLKSKFNNTNYVPAYESFTSDNPITSYPSDDFYGMLDSSEGDWDITPDVLDLGIGRLPVRTASEANHVMTKLLSYSSVPGTIETGNSCSTDVCYGLGDWMNVVTFIADDEDSGNHAEQADILATKVDTTYDNYNLDKIYLDAYQQVSTPGGERYPDATAAFMRRMDRGSLIVNYTGHGGEIGWAHERFLEIYHINTWKNKCRLPLFFTATCEFSRWDDPGRVSAGEMTLINTDGGSIGLMSTTRVVYSGPNFTLNNYFYNHTFVPMANGKMPRLGDLQMLTKNDMGPGQINHRNFSLLADPALILNYPDHNITTTHINGAPVNASQPDTVSALSTVTVQGEVRDKNGNLVTDFNGIVYPSVYDKAALISTLGNDPGSPIIKFLLQKNIVFKGKASVTNGVFSFSFIVPKDIAYNFGKGRISYYAHNGYEDASGSFEDFVVGGTDTTSAADADGPEIKLFMNDEKFIYGGITNTDPKIYAVVSDSNGINTAGSSIGHDITAVLDGNNSKPIVLNDYYESDMDNYKSGTVRYPLTDLEEGNHTLTVKVWDVYNNSSSSTTEFVVAPAAELALKHVLNYPNPFTTRTSFYFEHNKCCTTMDVQVQVFTISGKLVKTIQQQINLEGFRSDPIEWDGTDDFGDKIGRGVYVYRLRVKAVSGEYAEHMEKLVILK
ncbi:MAG: type IX secretion system sortase PorU [Bacteroidetes bacterium]|nr:MAG: type IX secretion system sortase PorU [Bacteroidota bacterium]